MLSDSVSEEMIEKWKETYEEYKDRLKPNRKSGKELLEFVKSNYNLTPFGDERAKEVIISNVINNQVYKEKLPEGVPPEPAVFIIEEEEGDIFFGVDLSSGYFHVEGSEDLWDELFAYQGLDEKDINNYFLVALYIECLKRTGMLDSAFD